MASRGESAKYPAFLQDKTLSAVSVSDAQQLLSEAANARAGETWKCQQQRETSNEAAEKQAGDLSPVIQSKSSSTTPSHMLWQKLQIQEGSSTRVHLRRLRGSRSPDIGSFAAVFSLVVQFYRRALIALTVSWLNS